ncbi:MAG: hypothetical protein PUC74_10785 [Succinatimonas sp.]|nr:hypothetical protein [Succinatimonas sp.]MDY5722118.1 hypothetical protein [Succinivibrio sp.]
MYIKDTKKIREKLLEILDNESKSNEIENNIVDYVGRVCNTSVGNQELFNQSVQQVIELGKEEGQEYSLEQAKINTMVAVLLKRCHYSDIKTLAYLAKELPKYTKILKVEDYYTKQYWKQVKVDTCEYGDISLYNETMPPLTLIICDSLVYKKPLLSLPTIGFFEENYDAPILKYKGTAYYSLGPKEIIAQDKVLDTVHGKVLNLGVNLGYFAFNASEKEDVEKVTIIENNQDLINLFKAKILPQFTNPEKIEIIHADYFEYMENLKDKEFDCCFLDIFDNGKDLLSYLKMKKLCHKFKKMFTSFCLEDEMANLLVDYAFIQLSQDSKRTIDVFYNLPEPPLEAEALEILAFIKKAYSKVKITTASELENYINPKTLIKLL